MKRALMAIVALLVVCASIPAAHAENSNPPHTGHITGKTVVGGILSFLIWPGIGQAINNDGGPKVATHAIIGLLPPFRFWSGYDALVDRHGGYWNGKI
jgi:hypothetical protein